MEPFNPSRRCVKCNGVNVAIKWVPHYGETPDYLRIFCCTCGYFWIEKPCDRNV